MAEYRYCPSFMIWKFDSILYEQRNAMNSMLPLGKKWLGLERTLETVSTAIYVPFTTQELFQPGGLYEGSLPA